MALRAWNGACLRRRRITPSLRRRRSSEYPVRYTYTYPLWERACSRKRCISRRRWRLAYRIREQARSHIDRVRLG
ncbi:hypothetical protein FRT60_00290 [Pseudomonas haemolytica]|uniref:Uncharacterized protein n=1 Tax=Pseudomonas haemolytica TaxID=2600065 RepID=A0A5P1DD77_9PSED|nr:hypothetical protein [Pseudomonas haemolytica]MRJ37448.1 hypothetical protein [Pseudomonas haemolytica]